MGGRYWGQGRLGCERHERGERKGFQWATQMRLGIPRQDAAERDNSERHKLDYSLWQQPWACDFQIMKGIWDRSLERERAWEAKNEDWKVTMKPHSEHLNF